MANGLISFGNNYTLVGEGTRIKDPLTGHANSSARRYDRIPVSIPVTLMVESGGKKVGHPSYMVDVSERGIKLKTNVAVTVGEVVEVIPADGPRYAVRSRVVWVGKAGSNQEGRLGLEFLDPIPTTSWGLATDTKRFN